MKSLYRNLAINNIKSNMEFYGPYYLVGIVSVMLTYCMNALYRSDGFRNVRGGNSIYQVLFYGNIIVALFVAILLFYTNSFIMKRRKRELGTYNILGMEKKHIARILSWETIFSAFICVVVGLVAGIIFNKLFTMLLYRLTGLDQTIPFIVSGKGCLFTAILTAGIFAVNLFFNYLQIRMVNPIELLHSGNVGEKEPRTNVLTTILGFLCLGIGYYLAVTTEDIIYALDMYALAIVLVIIGTYFLFTSGSIAVLKMMKRNHQYYYQLNHFTSVSGLVYRMKQNAIGLANICILSTMVLVMISSTVCMYAGLDEMVKAELPNDVVVSFDVVQDADSDSAEMIKNDIDAYANACGENAEKINNSFTLPMVSGFDGEMFVTGTLAGSNISLSDMYEMTFETRQGLMEEMDVEIPELAKDEVYILSLKNPYQNNQFKFDGLTYNVAGTGIRDKKDINDSAHPLYDQISDSMIVVVSDEATLFDICNAQKAVHDMKSTIPMKEVQYVIGFDLESNRDEQLEFSSNLETHINNTILTQDEFRELYSLKQVDSRAEIYNLYMTLQGGLFFLGIFLGIMFLMITVLIIYYKQISEGYQDRDRFVIMQKVGMSRQEVKNSISTQVRMVFFLPLLTAAIHLFAAFPMIQKILNLMYLFDTVLFVKALMGTLIIFAIIYFAVFRITSAKYYKIVHQ